MSPLRFMSPRMASRFWPGSGFWGALAVLWLAAPDTAWAQGHLDAKYEVTLAGIPVGKGGWIVDIGDDQFSASATGGTAGLMKTFSGVTSTGTSQGRIVNGALLPSAYASNTIWWKKSEAIHIALNNGNVKDFSIDPEPPVDPNRIPVTDAQKRGVFDPMTGALLRVAGTADLLSPDSCRTATTIFDGRMRYDLKMDFKRVETVKSEHGYHGSVLVCSIYFTPVAGYIPDRPVIKYLAAQRNMEIAFAPIAGTRVLVPYRLVIPTPLGTATLEATQFVTEATPSRTAKTN